MSRPQSRTASSTHLALVDCLLHSVERLSSGDLSWLQGGPILLLLLCPLNFSPLCPSPPEVTGGERRREKLVQNAILKIDSSSHSDPLQYFHLKAFPHMNHFLDVPISPPSLINSFPFPSILEASCSLLSGACWGDRIFAAATLAPY